MVILLRNLANDTELADRYEKLPCFTETTTMADLARIKHYRNQLAHFKDRKMKKSVFTTAWDDITGVRISVSDNCN